MGNLFNRNINIDQNYFKKNVNQSILKNSKFRTLKDKATKNEYQFERIDTYNGLFNTQQLLNVIDFSKFENHCFFDSAVSKVEYTFNKIFDEFPIDGTLDEYTSFFNNLDGFGKFIYNQFDKNLGYLKFQNSFVEIINKSGYLTSFNRNENILSKLTKPILNPSNNEFSIDFRLFIPDSSTNINQVILQYLNDNIQNNFNGFTLYIKDITSSSGQKSFANIIMLISNFDINTNNHEVLYKKFKVEINKWNHIVITISNENINKKMDIYVDSVLQIISDLDQINNMSSKTKLLIDDDINFYIGKANSIHSLSPNELNGMNYINLINNINYLNAYIDEFRFYHKKINQDEIINNKSTNVYASDHLKLYFRFNEPTGEYEKNMFCFDSSGNSLHSKISLSSPPNTLTDFRIAISNLRYNPNIDTVKTSLQFEIDDYNPCLMPTYNLNKNLNNTYINLAKEYDNFNPNLIFKLFPKHYFKEGALLEGLNENVNNQNSKVYYINSDENILTITDEENDLNNYPGQQKFEGIQTFAKLLTIWARFFDEIKIYLDILPKLIDISYSSTINSDSIDFLNNETVNFFIPLMAKLNGFEFKELLDNVNSDRLLDGYIIGADGIDKSQYSIRYVQNEIWKRILINSHDIISAKGTKNAIKSIFNSVGIQADDYYRFREYGKSSNKFITHSFNRRARDFKLLSFNQDINISLNILNTANSTIQSILKNNTFSFEFILNYNNLLNVKQENIFIIKNLTNNKKEIELIYLKDIEKDLGQLKLLVYYGNTSYYEIILNDINILNNRNYINLNIENIMSSNNLNLIEKIISLNYIENITNIVRTQKITIPKYIIDNVNTSPLIFLTNNHIKSIVFEKSIENTFNGNIMSIRMWKNKLSNEDMIDHLLNPISISNRNYQTEITKNLKEFLYFDLNLQDEYNTIDSFTNQFKNLLPLDFSENSLIDINNKSSYPFIIKIPTNKNQTDFFINRNFIVNENDLKFDEYNINNKVTSAGFFDEDLATLYSSDLSPIYEKNYINSQKNDIRFSIEMSNTKHLNEDIGKLFDSIDFFSDVISDFGTLNDIRYNSFEKFSDKYFKRLKNLKLNIIPLYELYQILDNVLTEMLYDFISSRVKFNNNVYVIESHSLERHKFHYKFLESHIVMKGNYDINSTSNSKKSYNYLNLEGRKG